MAVNEYTWFPLSVLGAIVYGSYSFLLSFMDPALKADKNAQLGYGVLLAIINIPINVIAFYLWDKEYKETSSKVLWKNINWKILLATVVVRFLIDPVHAVVINAGGAVAQQTMYSLAIIPVLVGGWVYFRQSLSIQQWVGLVMAGVGAGLMGIQPSKKLRPLGVPRKV